MGFLLLDPGKCRVIGGYGVFIFRTIT